MRFGAGPADLDSPSVRRLCLEVDRSGAPFVAWDDDFTGNGEIYVRKYIR